jgi:hypothetical protein
MSFIPLVSPVSLRLLSRVFGTQTSVETVAGGSKRGHRDGQGCDAKFNSPKGVGVDKDGVCVAFLLQGA